MHFWSDLERSQRRYDYRTLCPYDPRALDPTLISLRSFYERSPRFNFPHRFFGVTSSIIKLDYKNFIVLIAFCIY